MMVRKLSMVAVAVFAVAACEQSPTQPQAELVQGAVANAQDPYEEDGSQFTRFSGGGFIKGGTDSRISFGGETETADGLESTDMVIQFHSVADADVDGKTFHATGILNSKFFDNDSLTCVAAANVTLSGTLDGVEGYRVIYRAGDSGKIRDNDVEDTVRFEVFEGSTKIYDTEADSDFGGQSSCVGSARTNLGGGNVNLS